MFLEFYKLKEQPFGVTPDPAYLYLSRTHREALASLYYAIQTDCGFAALIAAPGMGKTTLLFQLMESLRGNHRTAFLFQTQCNSRELLAYLLTDLGHPPVQPEMVAMHLQLNEMLLRQSREGKRLVVVIDEAQNLNEEVLETLRLLSNFETPRRKLMQIVLAGQPQLAEKLSRPSLQQLRQRISTVTRLDPFSSQETRAYIEHRLKVAGCQGEPLFTESAYSLIAGESLGIPRLINTLCFNALSLGFADGQGVIDEPLIQQILADLDVSLVFPEAFSECKVPQEPALPPGEAASKKPPMDTLCQFLLGNAGQETVPLFPLTQGGQGDVPSDSSTSNGDDVSTKLPMDAKDQFTLGKAGQAIVPLFPLTKGGQGDVPLFPLGKAGQEVVPLFSLTKGGQGDVPVGVSKPSTVSMKAPQFLLSRKPGWGPHLAMTTAGLLFFILLGVPIVLYLSVNWTSPGKEQKLNASTQLAKSGEPRITETGQKNKAEEVNRLSVPPPTSSSLSEGKGRETVVPGGQGTVPIFPLTKGGQGDVTVNLAVARSPKEERVQLKPANRYLSIVVEPGETLQRICLRYLGRYSSALVAEIMNLNPALETPDHVEAGQRLHLPLPAG